MTSGHAAGEGGSGVPATSPPRAASASTAGTEAAQPPYDVFICYRRALSSFPALQLHEHLTQQFGTSAVFIDHDCLIGGEHWRNHIDVVLAHVETVIVLLASGWQKELMDRAGQGGEDQVVRELSVALAHRRRVYPVLLEGATAPDRSVLPSLAGCAELSSVLHALVDAQARPWRSTAHRHDLANMVAELAQWLPRFPLRLRDRCRLHLAQQLAGGVGVERMRNKLRALAHAVPRPDLQRDIDAALSRKPPLLVLHGEEGMGKTIALGWALQSLRDEAVLLADAGEDAWRQGFSAGCRRLLARHCDGADVPAATRLPLVVAIDGLNEAQHVPWARLLQDVLDRHDSGIGIRLIVTVRTGVWNRIARGLRHPELATLVVPPLNDVDFQALAERVGFSWQGISADVQQQLRRPRMLVAAARIPPDQLAGWELSYPLLRLLDLKERGSNYRSLTFDHFVQVLREMGVGARGRVHNIPRSTLRDLLGDLSEPEFEAALDELCDAGILRVEAGKFASHKGATNIALGLHLWKVLNEQGTSDHDALRERIHSELADGQDDSAARMVGSAITAGLVDRIHGPRSDLHQHHVVLAALIDDWQSRYNAGDAPARQARWLLPELIWLAEHTDHPDLLPLLVQAVGAGPPQPWRDQLRTRLGRWVTGIDPENESYTGPVDPDRVRNRRELLQQASSLAPIRAVPRKQAHLRRLGLDLAIRTKLDAAALPLLDVVLSIVVQPANGWSALERWVQASAVDWWPELRAVWSRVMQPDVQPELRVAVAELLRAIWPVPDCWSSFPHPDTGEAGISFRRLHIDRYARMVDRGQDLTGGTRDLLLMRTDPARESVSAMHDDLTKLALWLPHRLQEIVDRLVEQAVRNDGPVSTFIGTTLSRLAPLVRPAQARSLRVALLQHSDFKKRPGDYLGLVSWWSLPPARRVATVLQHVRKFDLSAEVLAAVPLDAQLAVAVHRRLKVAGDQTQSSRLAFLLYWGCSCGNADALRAALDDSALHIPETHLNDAGKYWLLRLYFWLGLPNRVTHMIPADWRYEPDEGHSIRIRYVMSAILAQAGGLSTEEVEIRCHSDHWHLVPDITTRDVLLERRARANGEELLAKDYYQLSLRTLSNQRLAEAIGLYPEVVERTLATVDSQRGYRAQELAFVLPPDQHPRWFELIEAIPDRSGGWGQSQNGIDERFLASFKAPDGDRARAVWDRLLDGVEHDAELLELVVAAAQGTGQEWLRQRAVLDPAALPHHQLRSATLAAMSRDPAQCAAIETARSIHGGWISKGFERALVLYESDELAQAWYHRFRTAADWYEAYGSWRMHLDQLDLRRCLWDPSTIPQHQLSDAERYERAFHKDVQNAVRKASDRLRKTRYGMDC